MWAGLIVLAAIVVWNAFFVAAEYAFVSSNPARLRELADGGSERARRVLELQRDPGLFISSVQVAITLAGLAAGAFGEPAVRALIERAEGPVETLAGRAVSVLISTALSFAIITAITVVLGEIVPKTFTLVHPERVATAVVDPVRLFTRVFRPFVRGLDLLARGTTRGLGLPSPGGIGRQATLEELRLLVEESAEEGAIDSDDRAMITGVFDLSTTPVRQIMVPRPRMIALPADLPVATAADAALSHRLSRYPVHAGRRDELRGFVHVRDLLAALRAGAPATVGELVRPMPVVPESKPIDALLAELRASPAHMAAVLDEYGSAVGIVTLEDILEEIVGPIIDEADRAEEQVVAGPGGAIVVDGLVGLDELAEHGIAIEDEDAVSIGGAVFSALGRQPRVGDRLELGGHVIRVVEVDGLRPSRLEVAPAVPRADDA